MIQRMMFLLTGYTNPVLGGPAHLDGIEPAVMDELAQAAQTVAATAPAVADDPGGGINMFWMYGVWILVFVGFYFIAIRPQRKRDKERKAMQSNIKVGDNVVTSGGLFGKVADVGQDCFIVEFGTNRGVRIPINKADVLGIRSPQLTSTAPAAVEEK